MTAEEANSSLDPYNEMLDRLLNNLGGKESKISDATSRGSYGEKNEESWLWLIIEFITWAPAAA